MIHPGARHETVFTITQAMVNAFAELSGDTNPVHTNPDYAATSVFKRPVIHGIFSAAIFSKVFGTEFPGEGTVYVSQTLDFKRPMYPDVAYKAQSTVLEVDAAKHTALIKTEIVDAETGKLTLTGEARIMNREKIG